LQPFDNESGCESWQRLLCGTAEESGEMSASERLQKRTAPQNKFPLNPLVYLCLLLKHMEKAKAKGGRPGLTVVSSCVQKFFAFSLACQKEQAPPLF
jgi:hypothetical protein